jgi:DNA damage-binding protein 1
MDMVGIASIPETIQYISNGVVFIGSIYGDSQLIRLKSSTPYSLVSASNKSSISSVSSDEGCDVVEIIECYQNIGPIIDMVVIESEKHSHCHVVTCSGHGKDASLRIIRSGIGIQEQV